MGKIEVNVTCIYEFSFLSMWLEVSWFLITPDKSDVAAPGTAGLGFCLGYSSVVEDLI